MASIIKKLNNTDIFAQSASFAHTASYVSLPGAQISSTANGSETTFSGQRIYINASNSITLDATNGISFADTANFNSGSIVNGPTSTGGIFAVSVRESAPTGTGVPGQIVPVYDGVNYRLYVYVGSVWKYVNLI